MELGFGAAHVPKTLNIWLAGVPSFAGWFLPYDRPILLVEETGDPSLALKYLLRLGYDKLIGYLAGGMLAWHMAGKESSSIRTASVQHLCKHLDTKEKEDAWILEVRSLHELETSGRISGAHHIHITELPCAWQKSQTKADLHLLWERASFDGCSLHPAKGRLGRSDRRSGRACWMELGHLSRD